MGLVASNRPRFSLADAEGIVLENWNITGTARELPSDRDQNFLIVAEPDNVVLKIASATEDLETLALQDDAMAALASSWDVTPRAIPSQAGPSVLQVESNGQVFLTRLLTWLPGTPMARVRPHSDELLRHLGEVLGQTDRALSGFTNETRRNLRWDLKQAFDVFETCGDHIERDERRAMFDCFVNRFRTVTKPALVGLREGWLQNDANDHNVLVKESLDGQRVSGIIDFGDMTYSWIVGEVAIACAYAMLEKPDPLAAACHVISGYHSAFALEERELAVLFDLICMRLCVSVAISAEQKRAEPHNEYLSVTEAPAWELLSRLSDISPDFAMAMFRHACQFEPCPKHDRIVNWLEQAECHPLVDLECTEQTAFVHDLSVSSSEAATLHPGNDPSEFDRLLAAERIRAGKSVGIGRYDEPRLCYASDQFSSGESSRRTIHIGLDIFADAGTQLFAPLGGTVHSVANNDKPLDYGPTIILRHATPDGTEFFTLYGHLSLDSIRGMQPGHAIRRGDLLAKFGAADVNGGWPPHVHFQIMTNMLGKEGDFPGVALPDERDVWLSLVPDPNLIARLNIAGFRCPRSSLDETHAKRKGLLGQSLSLSYRQPLKVVRGVGKYLYDDHGRAYLDTINNVAHVGHCHPHLVSAGQRQMAVLNTNTRYLHDTILEYSQRLTAKFPAPLAVVFLVNSGSEATELALRMARAHTGARDVVVLDSGYHGNTAACIDVSAYKFDGPGGAGAAAHVHKVRTPDAYRIAELAHGAVAADDVRRAIAVMKAKPAAFLAETIASCGGQIVPPEGYLPNAYQHARAAGAVCIADEVQTGFGRVGSHFWAFETQDVVPDIVTLGKPIGNGHPLAAVVTTRQIADSFSNGMEFFNTFGGNPVSSAIGMAVLDVIQRQDLQANARSTGAFFLDRLRGLADKHELIGDVRGLGLFLGIEFVRDRETKEPAAAETSYIVERMKHHGILTSDDGPRHNVIKIKPPMTFDESDVVRYCDVLGRVLSDTVLKR